MLKIKIIVRNYSLFGENPLENTDFFYIFKYNTNIWINLNYFGYLKSIFVQELKWENLHTK